MISLSSMFARKRKTAPQVRTWSGWYAILNKHGQLSEIRPNLVATQVALAHRGDRSECRIVPIEITVKRGHEDVPEHLVSKPKKKQRRKRR